MCYIQGLIGPDGNYGLLGTEAAGSQAILVFDDKRCCQVASLVVRLECRVITGLDIAWSRYKMRKRF